MTIIVLGFAMPLNPPNGTWQQQFMPDLHGAIIKDITFTDSLTGYAVTNKDSFNTAYILKTTNSGNNWFNSLTDNVGFTEVQFLNNNTGFVSRLFTPPGFSLIYKTIDGGSNWSPLNTPGDVYSMHVLSEDTIWIAGGDFNTGIFRTINGGGNWSWQYNSPSVNKVYMYNARLGFMCNSSSLYRTTNSGINWSPVPGGAFIDIQFIDTLTGWKSGNGMKKTTDGGLSWVAQILPSGSNIIASGMAGFSILSIDTIIGTGGIVSFGNDKYSGILYRSTNGGNNWLYQIPDTNFSITGYYDITFINKNIGWAFGTRRPPQTQLISYSNIHTTNGGDTTFLVGLQQVSAETPKEFKLYQNYPNPFNPLTNVKYSIMSNVKGQLQGQSGMSNVKLTVFDITGKEIEILVNEEMKAGSYSVDWDASNYPSGVYFYKITAGDYSESRKMILLK